MNEGPDGSAGDGQSVQLGDLVVGEDLLGRRGRRERV